jgi:hypothetical protein
MSGHCSNERVATLVIDIDGAKSLENLARGRSGALRGQEWRHKRDAGSECALQQYDIGEDSSRADVV